MFIEASSQSAPRFPPDGASQLSQPVAGGGATSAAGGAYALGGTIGQAAAAPSGEGAYTLAAGFWAGVGGTSGSVYLPLLVR